LFPERLEDYLAKDNPVRAIDVFVDELDLAKLGFGGVEPETTGRPAYHPAPLFKSQRGVHNQGVVRFIGKRGAKTVFYAGTGRRVT
jgi:hypothetical protein